MNERTLGRWVKNQLDQDLDALPEHAEWRLRQARESAVAAARQRLNASTTLSTGQGFDFDLFDDSASPLLHRILALLVFIVLLGIALYSSMQPHHAAPIQDIDTQLLTGDLPISAYLDEDARQWPDKLDKH